MYDLACFVFVLGTFFLSLVGMLKALSRDGVLDRLFPGYFWEKSDD